MNSSKRRNGTWGNGIYIKKSADYICGIYEGDFFWRNWHLKTSLASLKTTIWRRKFSCHKKILARVFSYTFTNILQRYVLSWHCILSGICLFIHSWNQKIWVVGLLIALHHLRSTFCTLRVGSSLESFVFVVESHCKRVHFRL